MEYTEQSIYYKLVPDIGRMCPCPYIYIYECLENETHNRGSYKHLMLFSALKYLLHQFSAVKY